MNPSNEGSPPSTLSLSTLLIIPTIVLSECNSAIMSPLVHETEPADGPGVTTQLCDWIQGLKLEDVPEQVQTRAKYLILDGLACALTGARVPWSVDAARAVIEFEEPGKHVLIGYNEVLFFLSFLHTHTHAHEQAHEHSPAAPLPFRQTLAPLASCSRYEAKMLTPLKSSYCL